MGTRLVLLLCLAAAARAEDDPPSTAELIARLDSEDADLREKAAEELADRGEDPVVPAIRARLASETNRHVRLALQFALASHGEIEGVVALIGSLEEKGHYGCGYLQRVTGREYGWNLDLWQEWLANTPPEDFRRRQERRFLTEEELGAGRAAFAAALAALRDEGDRARAAKLLEEVAAKHPRSDFAFEARPLAKLLRGMADEDASWNEPADPGTLTGEARIRYLVHRLRDVRVRQVSLDGCYALSRWSQTPGAPNASLGLAELGVEAVPALLEILEDRRPTRTLLYRDERGLAVEVLRYGDVAMQVLNAITPEPPFAEFSSGERFTEWSATRRREIADALRRWHREGCRSDPASRMWLRVDLLGLYPALDTLHALAVDHGRKEDVLRKLHEWYAKRHWVYRPHYAALMAELGDRSKVEEVLRWHEEGLYSDSHVERPDDDAASMNAEAAAKRLAAGLPRMRAEERWRDTGYGRR